MGLQRSLESNEYGAAVDRDYAVDRTSPLETGAHESPYLDVTTRALRLIAR
jgi:hypothetical protein